MAALLRMASPKNHTQPGSHSISSASDVPQHLAPNELPKLLKHCLSSSIKAMPVPFEIELSKIPARPTETMTNIGKFRLRFFLDAILGAPAGGIAPTSLHAFHTAEKSC